MWLKGLGGELFGDWDCEAAQISGKLTVHSSDCNFPEADFCTACRRLILHEENWFSLIRPLETYSAVTNAIGG
jgi:hypothetical protein